MDPNGSWMTENIVLARRSASPPPFIFNGIRVTTTTPKATWHRADITGLRSLAIIPVVVFHAGISQIPGGFIGVDMFYVISGFLITTLLVRDATAGRLHLGEFWARRLRRLLPASVVMVAATLVAGHFILSPLRWEQLGREALAAVVYVSNFVFAGQSTDYFAEDVAIPSPLIHTWSLGVEEQFYIFWPLIIIAVVALAKKSRKGIQFHLFWVFAVLTAASIALSVIWTMTMPQVAFYLLPTRVWEFALAGMLAIAFPYLTVPHWLRTTFGFVGFAGIAASLIFIGSSTPYPGTAALLPVVSTILVILAGPRSTDTQQSWPTRILSLKPFVWVGDVSYSWYLWHWPFIVLVPIALGNDALYVTLGAALASLGVAVLSYKFLENPVRFHPRLVGSIKLTLLFSLIAMIPVSAGAVATIAAGTQTDDPVVVEGVAKPLDLKDARFPPALDPCDRETELPTGQTICESGDLDSDTVLFLTGDSHAGHWRLALSDAAKAEGVRLVVDWEAGCPTVPITVVPNEGRESAPPCEGNRKNLYKLIHDLKPDALVLSQSDGYFGRISDDGTTVLPEDEQLDRWTTAYTEFYDNVRSNVGEMAVVIDNPRNDTDPNDCLATPGNTPDDCASPIEEVIDDVEPLHQATIDIVADLGITATLDTRAMLCDDGICRVVDNDVPVYRDFNHLSRQWTVSKVPELREFVKAALGR